MYTLIWKGKNKKGERIIFMPVDYVRTGKSMIKATNADATILGGRIAAYSSSHFLLSFRASFINTEFFSH